MHSRILKSLVSFVAVMALIFPAFAKDINKVITLPDQTKIAGKTLKGGDYTVKVTENKLTVELNRKVVVEAAGHWEDRANKSSEDGFETGPDGQVNEIHFSGEKRIFIVSGQ